ncbi:MAG: C4-type zinc ribbon domain-containing protein [Kiritimatiellaeota bacterium]|nr:C4-type zinc ribbon domain-containing protein [Kiritimatiellota bacterium]
MSVVKTLLDLQEIDGRIRTLLQEVKDIPQRKELEAARLNDAHAALEQAKHEMKVAQARIVEAELEVKARQNKITTLKQSQSQLKTNKEFQAYNTEIAKIEADIDNYEARLIVAMDDLIPRKQAVADRESKLMEEQAVVDAYSAELDARLAEVTAELETVEAARGDAAKQVQPRALLYYDGLRVRGRKWPVVVQLQEDGVCKGCNLRQPPSVVQQARRGQDLTTCQMCGRILYMG